MNEEEQTQDLLKVAYDEADAVTGRRVQSVIKEDPSVGERLEAWKSVMGSLDSWEVEVADEPAPAIPAPSVAVSSGYRWLKMAAIGMALLGVGILIGNQFSGKSPVALSGEVKSAVAAAMAEERARLAEELHQSILQSAGDQTHRLVTDLAEDVRLSLVENEERLAPLLLLLPDEHREAVTASRESLETVANAAEREARRTSRNLFLISTMAQKRAMEEID